MRDHPISWILSSGLISMITLHAESKSAATGLFASSKIKTPSDSVEGSAPSAWRREHANGHLPPTTPRRAHSYYLQAGVYQADPIAHAVALDASTRWTGLLLVTEARSGCL